MADETLPPVEAKLGVNTSEFDQGLDRAQTKMGDTERVGSAAFSKLAKGVGLGLIGAGAAVATFAASSVAKFSDVAGSIDGLMDITGESAEQMSRTRYAFTSWGVSSEQLEKGMLKLSKAVGANNEVFAQYNIATKDAQGNTLPMSEILANASDVFAGMPDGIEKNNLAMQLFGKAGTDLIDVLNGGSDSLKALGDEADRFGVTLGDKDVAAAEKAAKAKRQLSAAWEGLQLQLGKVLMPILAGAAGFLADHIPAAIATFRRVMATVGPVIQNIATWLGNALPVAIDVAVTAWGFITDGFQWLIDHQPILIGVAAAIGVGLLAMFGTWAAGALSAAAATIAATAPIIAIGLAIAAAVAGVIYAYEHWGWFRDTVDTVARFMKDTVWPILQSVFGWLRDNVPRIIGAVVDWFQALWDKTEGVRGFLAGAFKVAWEAVKTYVDIVWTAVSTAVVWFQAIWDKSETLRSLFVGGLKLAWEGIKTAVDLVWGAVETAAGWFQTAWDKTDVLRALFAGAFKTAVEGIKGAFDLIVDPIRTVVDWIQKVIDKAQLAIDKVRELAKGQVLDGVVGAVVSGVSGSRTGGSSRPVPGLATGGRVLEAGIAVVGEKGPEVVSLPRDAQVYPTGTGPLVAGGAGFQQINHFYGITDHTELARTSSAEMAWLMKTRAA